jgi:hypothetical protein
MSQPRTNKREMVGMILLIFVILLIPLFFAVRSLSRQPGLEPTPVPTKTVVANPSGMTPMVGSAQAPANVTTVTPASVTEGKQPPACTFPLAQIPIIETKPDSYSFSDPQVVRTTEKGNLYEIAEWLPDSQQILMTEQLRNVKVAEGASHQERIELFNPTKGTTKVYAIRPITHENPVWFPGLNSVIYPVINYYNYTPTSGNYTAVRQVLASDGNPDSVDLLVNNLSQIPFAIKPGGGNLLFFTKSSLSKLNTSLKSSGLVDFDSAQWDYATSSRSKLPVSFEMAWQPGTSLIFMYSDGAMGGGGYTYLLNADNGIVCELSLGGWALKAHWSSDGRYLAIILATDYSFPILSTHLAVMDSITGSISVLAGVPRGIAEHLNVDDFLWAPDNQQLLALGSVYPPFYDQSGNKIHEMYLIDRLNGQGVHILEEYKASLSPQDGNMAWSPDGTKLLVRCPTENTDQLCFISVRTQGK